MQAFPTSSGDRPYFTVVMATYNRGRHIVPSIKSVLAQSYDDFELLVVGDHCTDNTASVVASFSSPRIRWLNLERRGESQSFPNNAGIAQARGDVVAYIGHDDIWEPDHLARLSELFRARPDLSFAVSGAILYLPNSLSGSRVTGLFEEDSAKHEHFFPPSSFAHRRNVCERIGYWRSPTEIRPPVDSDFLLRAAAADLKFASTGRVTVHKFAAVHRHLSYIVPESHEQEAMLSKLGSPEHVRSVEAIVCEAKSMGTFMANRYRDYAQFAPGEIARISAMRRGLVRPELKPVGPGAVIHQEPSVGSLDWQAIPKDGIRWAGRNPKPRILLPFTTRRPVTLQIEIAHGDADALGEVRLTCNGEDLLMRPSSLLRRKKIWVAEVEARINLKRDDYSVLEFHLTEAQTPAHKKRGIGIGDIRILPIQADWRQVVRRVSEGLFRWRPVRSGTC